MIKLTDGKKAYNLVIDARVILNVFRDGCADVFRGFGGEEVDQNDAKRSRNQDEAEEGQDHCCDDLAELILLFDAGDGGNYREKNQRNHGDE